MRSVALVAAGIRGWFGVFGTKKWLFLAWGISLIASSPAWADTILGWSGSGQGSLEANATGGNRVGLPTDSSSLFQNPAGSSLTLNGLNLVISGTRVGDERLFQPGYPRDPGIQEEVKQFWTSSLGGRLENWGFHVGQWTPYKAFVGDQSLQVRENQIGFSRFFDPIRTSFGISGSYRQGFWESLDESTRYASASAFGASFGTLTHFPKRWFLGISYQLPTTILGPDRLEQPGLLSLGVGAWPNRHFRAHCSMLSYFATTTTEFEVQPACGMSYRPFSLNALSGWLHLGTYLEAPLHETYHHRLHMTAGMDFQISFVGVAGGIDVAQGALSGTIGIGINVDRLGKSLGYLPAGLSSPPSGTFPNPFKWEDDWMPSNLQMDPENAFQEIGPDLDDVTDGIKQLPKIWELPQRLDQGVRKETESILKDIQE